MSATDQPDLRGASQHLVHALAARYRIERELGRGGMATVYLADDLRHQRQVAIKVLHPELGAWLGPERFLSEIRITARLQHPNILPLLDSGDANGALYYVMPFVAGETLRARLQRERQLSTTEAVRIGTEIAGALAYAHAHGVIHRDIKPENILLGPPDAGAAALLADFGIARSLESNDRLTSTGITVGTAAYMSPEQATAEREIDARSDVYSLGCVIYEMLAGEPPFTGANARVILSKQLSDPVRPVRRLRDGVPPRLDAALATALGRSPADRFRDMASFATALDGAGSAAPAGRRRATRIGVAAAAVVGVAAAGWVVLSKPNVAAGMPSVRVQRFTPADTASAYLAATLQQDVVTDLAESRSARVFAMDSTRLRSGFSVTGVATRTGDSVEVRLAVFEDPTGEMVGRRVVRQSLGRVHELPRLASDAVLDVLGRRRAPSAAVARAPSTGDSIAYDFFLRGRYQTDRRTAVSTQRAIQFFRAALRRDSSFAEGWAGLARALAQARLRHFRIPEIPADSIAPLLIDASDRALDADSTRSYVWIARSMAIREVEPAARRNLIEALERAIALDSNNADAWHYLGTAWEDSLQPARALDAFRRALRIDPTHRQALGFMSLHFMWARQYDSAVVWGDAGKRIDPAHILIRQGLAATELIVGDTARAADDLRAEVRVSQGPDEGFGWAGLADIAMRQGRRAEADSSLRRAIAVCDTINPALHQAAYLAAGYAAMGENARAIRLLERYQPRADAHYQMHLQRDPLLDPLRSMPEFRALLVRKDEILEQYRGQYRIRLR